MGGDLELMMCGDAVLFCDGYSCKYSMAVENRRYGRIESLCYWIHVGMNPNESLRMDKSIVLLP